MKNERGNSNEYGFYTSRLGGMCNSCRICPFADRRPDSSFGRFMRWHRTWCPAYKEHKKIYGEKDLSK
jgi:hypothetical protein